MTGESRRRGKKEEGGRVIRGKVSMMNCEERKGKTHLVSVEREEELERVGVEDLDR